MDNINTPPLTRAEKNRFKKAHKKAKKEAAAALLHGERCPQSLVIVRDGQRQLNTLATLNYYGNGPSFEGSRYATARTSTSPSRPAHPLSKSTPTLKPAQKKESRIRKFARRASRAQELANKKRWDLLKQKRVQRRRTALEQIEKYKAHLNKNNRERQAWKEQDQQLAQFLNTARNWILICGQLQYLIYEPLMLTKDQDGFCERGKKIVLTNKYINFF